MKRAAPASSTSADDTTAAAAATAAEEEQDIFFVHTKTYPSGRGCYYGQDLDDDYIEACTRKLEYGPFKSEEEANQKALELRNRSGRFDDWAEEHYKEDGPPYYSIYGGNDDEDEDEDIYVVNESERKREEQQKIAEIQEKAKKRKVKVNAKVLFGQQPSSILKIDPDAFIRNPSRLPGAVVISPDGYPGKHTEQGFPGIVKKYSDYAYTCMSFCDDTEGKASACYVIKKAKYCRIPSHIWVGSKSLDDYQADPTIVDTVHLNLFSNKDGKQRLSSSDLLNECNGNIKALFINGFSDSDTIAKAISKCTNLRVLCIFESHLSPAVYDNIQSKVATLEGLIIHINKSSGTVVTKPEPILKLLQTSTKLKFLAIDEPGFRNMAFSFWNKLPDSLQVLFVGDIFGNVNNMLQQKKEEIAKAKARMKVFSICHDNKKGTSII